MWIIEPEEECSGGGSPLSIGYRRVVPVQQGSSRIGDIRWHVENGTFDYSGDPIDVMYWQDLDYSMGVLAHYWLKHNNAFGNKHRFTNSIGGGPDVGNAGFSAAAFVGAIPNYIIDHLTGLAFSRVNSGLITAASGSGNTWENAIDIIHASTENGFDDWFPLSINHVLTLFNMASVYNGTDNIGYGLTSTTTVAIGETIDVSTSVYWFRRAGPTYIQTGAQNLTSTIIMKCRNHY